MPRLVTPITKLYENSQPVIKAQQKPFELSLCPIYPLDMKATNDHTDRLSTNFVNEWMNDTTYQWNFVAVSFIIPFKNRYIWKIPFVMGQQPTGLKFWALLIPVEWVHFSSDSSWNNIQFELCLHCSCSKSFLLKLDQVFISTLTVLRQLTARYFNPGFLGFSSSNENPKQKCMLKHSCV